MLRSFIILQCLSLLAFATKVPIRQTTHKKQHISTNNHNLLGRDAADKNDRIYVVDVVVAGTTYAAQLDSGSSDLWISTTSNKLSTLNASTIQVNLTFGVGFAAGNVAVEQVEFAGFQVPRQAFLAATQVNNPITALDANALIGVGFNRLSTIDATINSTGGSYGRSLFFNMFAQDPSTANYMAVTLQRDGDAEDDVVGSISISKSFKHNSRVLATKGFSLGEVDEEFSGVLQTPRISTFPSVDPLRWTIPIDSISVNGTAIPTGTSIVSGAPNGKIIGLLDSGTSYMLKYTRYATQQIVNSIYGSVPGAAFSPELGTWILPCNAEVDVSLGINGRVFLLHPLDASIPTLSDNTTCQGSWIPTSFGGGDNTYDILFGVAALRSFVTLFNYGDFKNDMSLGDPFIQLWSLVTNGTEASDEFHTVRGGAITKNSFPNNAGVNSPSSSSSSSSSGSQGGGSVSDVESLQTLQNKVDRIYAFAPALFALTALNIILLLVAMSIFFLRMARRRKRKSIKAKGKVSKTVSPEESDPFDAEEGSGSFIPLARPNASAAQGQYRPVSMGTTLRESRLYDAPKSPGQEKSFNYDPVKGMPDDDENSPLPLPRPRAPALRNSFRPLSSGSTLRDSRLYDMPKSPGYDKFSFEIPRSSGYDKFGDSPISPGPNTVDEPAMPPSAVILHEPLISIQETPSQVVEPGVGQQHPQNQHDHSTAYNPETHIDISEANVHYNLTDGPAVIESHEL
ncbi:hypothetical protein Clacol_001360 [Clathrus columnatus]|uniref:Peptidase A1 domain-containing protein n=1 Tax=Clathrus columnatus TaxID=1419009 RepID=A0AAV5A2D0_9AGAM|nr:hypothetical protein Clacol_001360 [Clathrus columnatus]